MLKTPGWFPILILIFLFAGSIFSGCSGSGDSPESTAIQNENDLETSSDDADADDEETTATCSDGIQNQDETGVDCGGSCDACPTYTEGYCAPARLSGDQQFIVPDDAPVGEQVGVVKAYPQHALLGVAPVFSLDDDAGIYAVTSDGVLTVADNTGLTAGQDTLAVRVSKDGYLDQVITVTVDVLAADGCSFVDPSAATDGVGTRQSPRNEVGAIVTGDVVLFRRGTERVGGQITIASATDVILGAYDVGAPPTLSADGTSRGIRVEGTAERVTIRDLEVRGVVYDLSGPTVSLNACISVAGSASDVKILHCELHRATQAVSMDTGSISEIQWNDAHTHALDGMFLSGNGPTVSILVNANYVHDINEYGYIYNNENDANGDCIQSDQWVTFTYNFFDRSNTDFKFAVISGLPVTFIGNYFEMGDQFGRPAIFQIDDSVYSGNFFHRGGGDTGADGVVFINGGIAVFENNIWVDTPVAAIRSNGTYEVYNNVFYNVGAIVTSGQVTLTNNILSGHGALGGGTLSWQNNLAHDGPTPEGATNLTADPLFIDAAQHNFRLQDTSPAIDAGEDVGLQSDYDGVAVPQGAAPDIGAFEHAAP